MKKKTGLKSLANKEEKIIKFIDEKSNKLKQAEERIGDPDITGIIIHYQRRISGLDFTPEIELN